MLSFQHIDKRFADGTLALDGVSLDIPKGQFCVILGPSGSGKSTLLRCVNGLIEPTAGKVSVGGVEVGPKTLRTIRPRVGMIHQQFHLVPRLTVLGNVLTGALPQVSTLASMLGIFPARTRRKACDLLQEVGLDELHLYRRGVQLSGGQQQRVAIARAFIMDPDLVLADEPVASLDPRISRDILTLLKRASQRRGVTVLCSLHQLELAREFADRLIALREGRIVYDGPPEGLEARATHTDIYGESSPPPQDTP